MIAIDNTISSYNEFVFSLNKFGKPKTLKDKEAIYTLLVRLILLEPGTIQSHPEMGVGLVSKYRYAFEDQARELQQSINDQMQKYLPSLQGADVQVTAKDSEFIIEILIDGVLYDFNFDSSTGTLTSLLNI